MTIEEFNKTGFTGKMKCLYKGQECKLVSVDFEEKLIGLIMPDNEYDDMSQLNWVRCENVTLLQATVMFSKA